MMLRDTTILDASETKIEGRSHSKIFSNRNEFHL